MKRLACAFLLVSLASPLAGCGGMNRTIAVLPNALDDLGRQSEGFRRGRGDRPGEPERVQPPPGGF